MSIRIPDPNSPWVTVYRPEPAVVTSLTQWRVKSVVRREGAGNTLYIQCVDEKGVPVAGQWFYVIYPNLAHEDAEGGSPYKRQTDAHGKSDFPIFSIQRATEPGPYNATIRITHADTPAQYVDGYSEIVMGIGNHENRHDSYDIVFERVNVSVPHQTLEQAVKLMESTFPRMPINTDAALYKYAQAHGLGYPQGDEHHFQWDGQEYIFQTFNGGIVYAPLSDVNDVKVILK